MPFLPQFKISMPQMELLLDQFLWVFKQPESMEMTL